MFQHYLIFLLILDIFCFSCLHFINKRRRYEIYLFILVVILLTDAKSKTLGEALKMYSCLEIVQKIIFGTKNHQKNWIFC